MFSLFLSKTGRFFLRVSQAGMIWDGAGEFKEVMDGVGCKIMVVFGEISLVVAFSKI